MRIALFGGSFDPPHRGHLHVLRVAREQLGLDEVWLLPAHRPPHKSRPLTADRHRAAMCRLLCQEEPGLRVDSRELLRRGTSYTIDTVTEIRAERAGTPTELFFLIGADSLAELHTWHRIHELLRLIRFVTIPRPPGDDPPDQAAWQQHFSPAEVAALTEFELSAPALPHSSTRIREALAAGESGARGQVTAAVARYIEQHGLYAPARPARENRGDLSR